MAPATDHWEHRCIISGIGISPIGRRTEAAPVDLVAAAAREAIADAGLTAADIDGATTVGELPLDDAVRALGLTPAWTGEGGSPVGGSMSGVHNACRAVADRRARHVLVYRSVAMLGGAMTGAGRPGAGRPGAGAAAGAGGGGEFAAGVMGDMSELMAYHAYSAANWVALHLRRHMHLYGTTREQLGWIALNARRHAALNPLAVYRDELTMPDYLGARWISDPLGLYDCDVPIDGATAFVVSAADHAGDTPKLPVRVNAAARVGTPGGWIYRPDFPKMASIEAARELWNRTDLRPSDLDVAELYDGFSFLTLAWLEALGICGEGESGAFVEGGERIRLGGQLPLNTYGGQLSAGRMHGHWVLHEACTQLRGEGAQRQVAGAEVAVVSTSGGPIATCMLLTR